MFSVFYPRILQARASFNKFSSVPGGHERKLPLLDMKRLQGASKRTQLRSSFGDINVGLGVILRIQISRCILHIQVGVKISVQDQ